MILWIVAAVNESFSLALLPRMHKGDMQVEQSGPTSKHGRQTSDVWGRCEVMGLVAMILFDALISDL